MVKFSIITVCLNSRDTICKAIESVIKQKYHNFEYIIIDGASTDGTLDIIKKFQQSFPSVIRYISEQDDGIYDAMNKGITMSCGDYIGIINADDWYEEDVFGTVNEVVTANGESQHDVIYGKIRAWENGQIITYSKKGDPYKEMWWKMAIPHPATFVRKSLYEKYGLYDTSLRIAGDYKLFLKLVSNNVKFTFIDKVLANFSLGGISTTNHMLCAHETNAISFAFLDKCPDPQNVIDHCLQRLFISRYITAIIRDTQSVIDSLMRTITNTNVIIFGTGEWAEKLYPLLEEAYVKYCVDNDSLKWGTMFHGLEICDPQILSSGDWLVVVASYDYTIEILNQLRAYDNKSLRVLTLFEIVENYMLDVGIG